VRWSLRTELFQLCAENHAQFFSEGREYYKRYLDMISSANYSVYLQTYIFEIDNNFGSAVHAALLAAAVRGVKVYVLVDSVGSRLLQESYEQELKIAGVHFCRFNKIKFKWLGQWGRRLHHKILICDNRVAMVGGINVISDSYGMENIRPTLDFAVYLEGPTVHRLSRYCEEIFTKAYQKKVFFSDSPVTLQVNPECRPVTLRVSVNDWMTGRCQITSHYSQMVHEAKESITIINSYFFPRMKFMRQLVLASKRGVRVRLILPKYSDWPSWVLASQYLYNYFLKHGIEVYQWKSSMLHGKLATVDGQSTTIGSFNLNYTSYQQNLEMNVDVFSPEFTQEIDQRIESWLAVSCEKIEFNEFAVAAGLKIRILRMLYYLLLSMIASFSVALSFAPKIEQQKLKTV
jgi:cardiolipin synthase